jgi:DNA-binding transcriptional LysR family regulator
MLTRDMAVLVTTWREGSFPACATAMKLSALDVAFAVRRIECHLGFKVFERRGSAVVPLPGRESLLENFEQILDTLDHYPPPGYRRGARHGDGLMGGRAG